MKKCGKQHNHTYGSGRFCSETCAKAFGNKRSEKLLKHLALLNKKSPYGTWKCEECNLIFETRALLDQHNKEYHGKISILSSSGKEKKFACPYCEKEFDIVQQMGGHLSNCPKHPNNKKHDEGHKKSGKTYHENYLNGKFIKSSFSHPHTNETKEHLSKIRSEQVKNEYLTNFHAKVKWYKIKNLEGQEFLVRGHWEENVANRLNELGIVWVKAPSLRYFKDYWHHYTADFYIPSMDVYVEVKGRYPDTDREKMRLVVKQNPDKKIYFIHESYQDFINKNCEFDDNLLIKTTDL